MEIEDTHSTLNKLNNQCDTKSRLGLCEVCNLNNAKYTCPRCELKTCTLACNKIHKFEVECNGQRDRTKFISVNKFTNLDLSNDYRLLEEVARVVDTSKKSSKLFNRKHLSKFSLKLKDAATLRGTTLLFLPFKFEKHYQNKTRYNIKLKTINWQIEFIFLNADNYTITDNVLETTKLSTLINKYLYGDECNNSDNNSNKDDNNYNIHEKFLQYYQSADITGIKLLLKAEQKSGNKFYDIDPYCTLQECLKDKIIIEYPIFYVVLIDHSYGFNLIDSDDEDNVLIRKNGNYLIERLIKKCEKDESMYHHSQKNLLFTNSDDDDDDDDKEDNDGENK